MASDIVEQLRQTLQARRGVDAGVTWRSLKRAVEEGLGVKDDDIIGSIEVGVMQMGSGLIVREDDEHGNIDIKELSYGCASPRQD